MFRPEEIQARLRLQPFRPLRIIANEGLRYEIRHPDLVLVGERYLMIGHESPGVPGVFDRMTQLAIVHVVAIEEITAVPSETNGTAG